MAWRTGVLIAAIGTACGARGLAAQPVDRASYYRMLPPRPKIVAQIPASAMFRLFGDPENPGFTDRDPADGTDDARGAVLLRLAERFSPILRPNNVSVPRHPFDVMNGDPVMHVDRWLNGRRVSSDSLQLGFGVRQADANAGGRAAVMRSLSPLTAGIAADMVQ